MSSPVIIAKNIGKRYCLNDFSKNDSLKDAITSKINFIKNIKQSQKNENRNFFWALKEISFEIHPGEVVGIIGRNGAGKSTLLKILSKITYPTEGHAEIKGLVGSLLEVGTGFHPELTGSENIFLSGSIIGMKKREIEEKFNEIVKFAEIEKFLDTPVKRYSSGMYIRLAFSVAAHLEPNILIVDEVLAVGDLSFQKKCLGRMDQVAKEGRTVIFVSHNLSAIKSLCHRVILLENGNILQDGNTNEVIQKYLHRSTNNQFYISWNNQAGALKNASIVIKSIKITDKNQNKVNHLTIDDPFNVEIEYEVIQDNSSVGLTLIFYDNQNNCLFSSINNHEMHYYGKFMQMGHYVSICKIPPYLFNSGWVKLSMNIFGKNYSDQHIYHDLLQFEIFDGSYVRGDYFGEYGGFFRPYLNWNTFLIKG